jgi:hypothetical protein
MSGHTPGPWTQDPFLSASENDKGFRVSAPDARFRYVWIADVSPVIDNDRGDASEEGKANASLIAAAPDMLAALKVLAGTLKSTNSAAIRWPEVVQADAAIAKAEGR